MPLRSIHHILGSLEKQGGWQEQQQFQRLVACWVQTVGTAVAAQTRPLFIQRQVLQVATSSSAWAQNLAFERCRLLEKLNVRLSTSLTDIRFSPAQWQSLQNNNLLADTSALGTVWQDHPSRIQGSSTTVKPAFIAAHTPESAFHNWAEMVRRRSQHLSLCSICQCPTPAGELARWSVCALCAVKQM
jgi:predicted nucleic acid-binding Zn ribbon protein